MTKNLGGQFAFNLTQNELMQSGYKIEPMSDCAVKIIFGEKSFYATCDMGRIDVVSKIPL